MTPERLLHLWGRLSHVPGGRWLFGRLIALGIPYSASTGARVESLEPGHCVVVLQDRRGVRNHLRSIHAVALTNVGELASGLAMTTALPVGTRAIVTRLTTEYVKKARGTIRVECRVADPPRPTAPTEVLVDAVLTDGGGGRAGAGNLARGAHAGTADSVNPSLRSGQALARKRRNAEARGTEMLWVLRGAITATTKIGNGRHPAGSSRVLGAFRAPSRFRVFAQG